MAVEGCNFELNTRPTQPSADCTEPDLPDNAAELISGQPSDGSSDEHHCAIFIKASSVFSRCKFLHARQLDLLVYEDTGVRIHFKKLFEMLLANRTPTVKRLYGNKKCASFVQGTDNYLLDNWDTDLTNSWPGPQPYELVTLDNYEIDTTLSTDAVLYSLQHEHRARNETVVLVVVDKVNYSPTVAAILSNNVNVEVVSLRSMKDIYLDNNSGHRPDRGTLTFHDFDKMFASSDTLPSWCFIRRCWNTTVAKKHLLSPDRSYILRFGEDLENTSEIEMLINSLADELTSLLKVPCLCSQILPSAIHVVMWKNHSIEKQREDQRNINKLELLTKKVAHLVLDELKKRRLEDLQNCSGNEITAHGSLEARFLDYETLWADNKQHVANMCEKIFDGNTFLGSESYKEENLTETTGSTGETGIGAPAIIESDMNVNNSYELVGIPDRQDIQTSKDSVGITEGQDIPTGKDYVGITDGQDIPARKDFVGITEGQDILTRKGYVGITDGQDIPTRKDSVCITEGQDIPTRKDYVGITDGQDIPTRKDSVCNTEGQDIPTRKDYVGITEGQDIPARKDFVGITEGQDILTRKDYVGINDGQDIPTRKDSVGITEGQDIPTRKDSVGITEGQDIPTRKDSVGIAEGQDIPTSKDYIGITEGRDIPTSKDYVGIAERQDIPTRKDYVGITEGQDIPTRKDSCFEPETLDDNVFCKNRNTKISSSMSLTGMSMGPSNDITSADCIESAPGFSKSTNMSRLVLTSGLDNNNCIASESKFTSSIYGYAGAGEADPRITSTLHSAIVQSFSLNSRIFPYSISTVANLSAKDNKLNEHGQIVPSLLCKLSTHRGSTTKYCKLSFNCKATIKSPESQCKRQHTDEEMEFFTLYGDSYKRIINYKSTPCKQFVNTHRCRYKSNKSYLCPFYHDEQSEARCYTCKKRTGEIGHRFEGNKNDNKICQKRVKISTSSLLAEVFSTPLNDITSVTSQELDLSSSNDSDHVRVIKPTCNDSDHVRVVKPTCNDSDHVRVVKFCFSTSDLVSVITSTCDDSYLLCGITSTCDHSDHVSVNTSRCQESNYGSVVTSSIENSICVTTPTLLSSVTGLYTTPPSTSGMISELCITLLNTSSSLAESYSLVPCSFTPCSPTSPADFTNFDDSIIACGPLPIIDSSTKCPIADSNLYDWNSEQQKYLNKLLLSTQTSIIQSEDCSHPIITKKYCHLGFNCKATLRSSNRQCKHQHTEEEMEFFTLYSDSYKLKINYKSTQCLGYRKRTCQYIGTRSYLCPYYHVEHEEARCYTCCERKGKVGHPFDPDVNNNTVCKDSSTQINNDDVMYFNEPCAVFNEPCAVFIDNSLLRFRAKRCGAVQQNYIITHDDRLHVNIGRLLESALNNREVRYVAVYGNYPEAFDSIWNRMIRNHFQVCLKSFGSSEKNSKTIKMSLTVDVLSYAFRNTITNRRRQSIVIISRSNCYMSLGKTLQDHGFNVQIALFPFEITPLKKDTEVLTDISVNEFKDCLDGNVVQNVNTRNEVSQVLPNNALVNVPIIDLEAPAFWNSTRDSCFVRNRRWRLTLANGTPCKIPVKGTQMFCFDRCLNVSNSSDRELMDGLIDRLTHILRIPCSYHIACSEKDTSSITVPHSNDNLKNPKGNMTSKIIPKQTVFIIMRWSPVRVILRSVISALKHVKIEKSISFINKANKVLLKEKIQNAVKETILEMKDEKNWLAGETLTSSLKDIWSKHSETIDTLCLTRFMKRCKFIHRMSYENFLSNYHPDKEDCRIRCDVEDINNDYDKDYDDEDDDDDDDDDHDYIDDRHHDQEITDYGDDGDFRQDTTRINLLIDQILGNLPVSRYNRHGYKKVDQKCQKFNCVPDTGELIAGILTTSQPELSSRTQHKREPCLSFLENRCSRDWRSFAPNCPYYHSVKEAKCYLCNQVGHQETSNCF